MRLLLAGWLLLVALTAAGAAEVFVAPAGDDANPGTLTRPFRTIGHAAGLLQPGDTCWLRAGVYRETVRPANSGAAGKPIRFAAYKGEAVTVSGADPLTGEWTRVRGDLWRLATDRKFIQLFSDGKMLLEGRWPNADANDLMGYPRAMAGAGTDQFVLADPKLPPGDWNGAVMLLWNGARWTSDMRRVTEYQPGKSFRYAEDFTHKDVDKYNTGDPTAPVLGNPYILYGCLAAVDQPGEWFLDEAAGTLYLQLAPGDTPQEHRLAARQRDLAFDLSKLSYIGVRGLDITGAALNMTDSQRCVIEDCRLRYIQHVREWTKTKRPVPLNVVSGQNNVWRHCLLAYAALPAIRVTGEGNRLENCIVHDADYTGSGQGGVCFNASTGAVITHCSLFRAGRDLLAHHGSKRITIEYNDLYLGNMLNNDAGAMYSWGTDGEGSSIAYNWVHDQLGDATCGIYLDNFCKNFHVHHNLVWNTTGSGIRLNSDATNHVVANNTIAQVEQPFGTFCYVAYKPTMQGTRILNNLVNAPLKPRNPGVFVQGELGPELGPNAPAAVDRDGVPTRGSAAIDAGAEIAGLTDGFKGKAPDLGCYEFGAPRWTAGADWTDPQAPPAPKHDLTFAPQVGLTAQTMPREGLLLWLDAADPTTLTTGPDGSVIAWRSRLDAKLAAVPLDPAKPVKLTANALNGKAVVRGTGVGALRVTMPPREPGPLTFLIVSQGLEGAGPEWQRIAAASQEPPQEWIEPNWIIMRPGADKPVAYPAQIFSVPTRHGRLDRLTILGASSSPIQHLCGDVAEVLVFGRTLRFDETLAVQDYLVKKWGLK